MSWWGGLVKRVVGIFSGAGQVAIRPSYGGRRGDPPVRGTREFLEVYETSPWVRAVAARVSAGVGATEWKLSAKGGRAVPDDHIMLKTLQTPNPVMTGF